MHTTAADHREDRSETASSSGDCFDEMRPELLGKFTPAAPPRTGKQVVQQSVGAPAEPTLFNQTDNPENYKP